VDKTGDVWIASYGSRSVQEFAHGGSAPIATLATSGYPVGCSIDPTTGNLAVSELPGTEGAGVIQIWNNGSGIGTYSNATVCYYPYWPGYDNKGNLYFEALPSSRSGINVCELPAGGSATAQVPFNEKIYDTGSVMWDGKYITLADTEIDDSETTGVYQASELSSGGLTAVNSTVLTDTCYSSDFTPVPFIVGIKNTPANTRQGTVIIGFNEYCAKRFNYWAYPGGGNPTASLGSLPVDPIAESVSIL
jgi:hypothetical protein